jgi:transcriptional regulator with XRE-family HTH domain
MSKNILKKIRKEKNISQIELANIAGVSKQLLSGFENGRSGISNDVLFKIANYLDVSSDYIITGKNKNIIDEQGKKILQKAMSIAFDFYGDEFDKETLIKISSEIYSLMVDFEEKYKKLSSEDFEEFLNNKIAVGLAAKCLLNSSKK